MTLDAIAATSSDSSVAVVRDGALVPLAVGRSRLMVDYGGITFRTTVLVRRTVFEGTLELKSGESRQWPLVPGRYAVTVKVASRRDLNMLSMETDGLNCSRDSRDADTIHCVGVEGAVVTLVNGNAWALGLARAHVRILQVP